MILQWLKNPAFRYFENLLVEHSKNDQEFGEKMLEKIYALIKEILNQEESSN